MTAVKEVNTIPETMTNKPRRDRLAKATRSMANGTCVEVAVACQRG